MRMERRPLQTSHRRAGRRTCWACGTETVRHGERVEGGLLSAGMGNQVRWGVCV
jgi:hypothetical protein